jgi:aminoglycoside phosphotransferase (APT) family kinase protein
MADATPDMAAVCDWVDGRLPGFDAVHTVTKFTGGQSNPTFRIDTDAGRYVLRRKPLGKLLKSAHAVEREFRVQRALAPTDVPVAPVHLLCEDDTVTGSAFYLMDLVDGDSFHDPRLPDLTRATRTALFAEMADVLGRLHRVDPAMVGLADYGPSGNYFARQLSRWSGQYAASETGPVPAMDRLIAQLTERLPEDDGQLTLVHGDFRLDNLIFERSGSRCLAVLDWELSTLGHPYADVAGVIMQWQMPVGSEGRGLDGVDRASLGVPSDTNFVAQYCAHRGIDVIPDFGVYVAFAFFRMAAILQGVKKRALDGNAANPEHGLRMGTYVPAFAAKGLAALG